MRFEIEVLERPEFEDLEVTRNLSLVSLLRKGEFSRGQPNSRDGGGLADRANVFFGIETHKKLS